MLRLVQLSYSPWSERARWALDHHGVEYRKQEHIIMLGEPLLQLRLGKIGHKASVPILFGESWALTDSYDIAHYADRVGGGSPLFPPGHETALRHWNDCANQLAGAGRARTTARAMADPEVLRESVPGALARLGALRLPIARQAARFLGRKYSMDESTRDEHLEQMDLALEELRAGLAGGDYLVADQLTYADIAMATSLQFVAPVDERYIRLGTASRKAWSEPALAARYADLVAWRDRLYERHREPRVSERAS